MVWDTIALPTRVDTLAPDGAEIRYLGRVGGASMVHCRLAADRVTRAVRHRTVEELWYCLSGNGQLWRSCARGAEIVDLRPGVAVTIPLGTAFQFRALGAQPLELVIATTPPWPGADEAEPVEGAWAPIGVS